MQITDALTKFLVQLEADGRSCHTIAQYRRHIRLFAHWAAEVDHSGEISEISHEVLAAFLVAPEARTRPDGGRKKETSTNALRSSVRNFFRYLHQAGYIDQDPARLIRRAICGSPPPRALSDDEVTRLMATLEAAEGFEGRRDHALFHTMLATGIRLGSAVALDVEDVDLGEGLLMLRATKGDRPDVVYLGREIRDHLQVFVGERTHGPLFTSRRGERLSHRHVQRRFGIWLEKASITRRASCHCLRHTFATSLYIKSNDILLVQSALKHRSIISTTKYAQLSENRLRLALEIL